MTHQQTLLPQNAAAQRPWLAAGAVIVAIAMWAISLALPVWETRSNHGGDWGTVIGALPAAIGFLGLLVLCPAWFANLAGRSFRTLRERFGTFRPSGRRGAT
jgi:hypothetical protein